MIRAHEEAPLDEEAPEDKTGPAPKNYLRLVTDSADTRPFDTQAHLDSTPTRLLTKEELARNLEIPAQQWEGKTDDDKTQPTSTQHLFESAEASRTAREETKIVGALHTGKNDDDAFERSRVGKIEEIPYTLDVPKQDATESFVLGEPPAFLDKHTPTFEKAKEAADYVDGLLHKSQWLRTTKHLIEDWTTNGTYFDFDRPVYLSIFSFQSPLDENQTDYFFKVAPIGNAPETPPIQLFDLSHAKIAMFEIEPTTPSEAEQAKNAGKILRTKLIPINSSPEESDRDTALAA